MKLNRFVSQKIVEQCSWLSNWMVSEFDRDGERNFQLHMDYVHEKVNEFQEYYKGNAISTKVYIDPWLLNMANDLMKIRNNVFIPKNLKKRVFKYYSLRREFMLCTTDQIIKKYIKLLKKKELDCEDEIISALCWNEINDAYYDKKIGWSDVELKVQYFNKRIQKYLFTLEE